MIKNGIFLPYEIKTGKENMEIDEKILDYAIANQCDYPFLRFYGWSPACVSLGRNQNETHIKKEFCIKNNIDIVKRLTGGRALLHDNELTYSFVCPVKFLKNGETIINSYKEISGALALGFRNLGLDVNFPEEKKAKTHFEYCMSLSTGADLSYKGKKIVGSAQFRKQGYILQHGAILFNYDTEKIRGIFSEEPESDKITTLNDINTNIDAEGLCNALKSGVEEFFAIQLKTNLSLNQF